MGIKVATFNARGLSDLLKRKKVFEWAKLIGIDILAVQETNCKNLNEGSAWARDWGGEAYWSFAIRFCSGVAILINKKANLKVDKFESHHSGRLVTVNVSKGNFTCKIVCVYVHATRGQEKIDFINMINKFVRGNSGIILLGDFNLISNQKLDRNSRGWINKGGLNVLEGVINPASLVDVYREKNPLGTQYTWHQAGGLAATRIDRVYVSKELLKDCGQITTHSNEYSDHGMVVMDFKIRDSIRGKSYWKANVSVFRDIFFKEDLSMLWERGMENQSIFDLNWWLDMKVEICNLIKIHSFRLNYVRKGRLIEMCKKFNSLLSEEPRPYKKIEDLGKEIDKFMESHLERIKRKVKISELNYGENIMSDLFKCEKRKASQKTMAQLESDSGEVLTNKNDIIDCVSEFYRNLYAEIPSDPASSEYFLKDRPKLSKEEQLSCEGAFTLEELAEAVKKSRGSTSPGVDGLPIEFYKSFLGLIGPKLILVFNSIVRAGWLGEDQNCAAIVLLCKKPEAAEKLKNWRPISLLCNDLKLITKMLSVRMGGGVMESIIGKFQNSCVKGRQIFSNVHLIRNIAEYLNQKGKSAALLSMDQSKAFDRVSHKFLFKTLQFAGFGTQFISWIEILYKSPTLKVIGNGQLTGEIPVKRRVRQGSSSSKSLLYVTFRHKRSFK